MTESQIDSMRTFLYSDFRHDQRSIQYLHKGQWYAVYHFWPAQPIAALEGYLDQDSRSLYCGTNKVDINDVEPGQFRFYRAVMPPWSL